MRIVGLVSGVACIACLAAACGGDGDTSGRAPPEIRGRWTTTDSAYADRAFEISDSFLVFDTGAAGLPTRHRIVSLERNAQGRGVFYEFRYSTGGPDLYRFGLFHFPESGGVVRFRNQPEIVWTKEEPASP